MTFYIAGRVHQRHNLVKEVRDAILNLGHSISFDWTQEPNLQPYSQNRQAAITASLKMKQGAMEADVLILVWDDSLYGALVELGMNLAASTQQKPKQIFIVGKKERVAIFEMLPEFQVVETIDQLVQQIKDVDTSSEG